MTTTETVDLIELMYRTGWSDGLPLVPPTEDKVRRCVESVGRPADEVVAAIPPMGGKATVERVAANAVMAGCLPEYMPVVLAAIEASMDDRLNLRGVQCSTGIHSPLVIVNGPIAAELDINGGYNCFGQGWRANATIGRAVKLTLVNLGGSIPGEADKATFGHPGKFSFCIAESETANPWEPLHVEHGYGAEDSTVAVYACEAPHNIMYHAGEPRDFLLVLADTMSTLGNVQMYVMGETLVVLGPEHARMLHQDGWRKRDIRQFLFEHARQPVARLKHGGPPQGDGRRELLWPKFVDPQDDAQMVPVVRRPEDIHLIVAGGAGGPHSACLPGWGSRMAMRKIASPGG